MSPVDGVPAAEAAQDLTYAWLRTHVASMPRHSGGFITESEVARALHVSRTPVREAMLRLQAEGLLHIMPKKGAYVSPISNAETQAVMEARSLVEDWCARRAAVGVDGLVDRMRELLAEQRRLTGDPVAFIECDRRFHRALVEGAGNVMVAGFYESLRDRQVRMGLQALNTSKDRATKVLVEHLAIVDAIASQDPDKAGEAVATHLQTTRAILLPAGASGSWSGIGRAT
jgi:DNA-binding GntR family transcriptional regulator